MNWLAGIGKEGRAERSRKDIKMKRHAGGGVDGRRKKTSGKLCRRQGA